MKRILFMHQASTIGGGSYCLLNILREIDKSNIEPVACLASDGPLRMEIEKLGIEVVIFTKMAAVPYNRSLWSYSSARAYWRVKQSISSFKQLLNDKNIDVVYLNNMMIYKYLKPAKECGCKTVLHCREHWPLDEHIIQLKWAQNEVYQYADELIAINHYSASIFSKKKATIVYDWIDMDSRYEYRPMSDILGEEASGKKVYLYTGGVQKIKGAVEVLSAFKNIITDKNARLLVLGINPNGDISWYKQLLSKIGIKSYYYRVKELIKTDSRIKCIPATYMLSHIIQQCYCNLSYFTIPHANLALAEAQIMGCPSIAADNEEAREYSLNGQLSLLFAANDYDAFGKAIKEMDYRHSELVDNLYKYATEIKCKFSKETNVKNINRVIYNLFEL